MQKNDFLKLVTAIVISQLAGIIGSIFTANSVRTWYVDLVRPDLAPPSWVFGPVWVTLFALMGVAAFLVWRKGLDYQGIKPALGVFGVQLILNTLWSVIFFGFQSPGGALVEIFILWLAIVMTMYLFGRVSRTAAWLLVPYLAWVSFAAYLNYAFWILNR